jgi:hypothetical protein
MLPSENFLGPACDVINLYTHKWFGKKFVFYGPFFLASVCVCVCVCVCVYVYAYVWYMEAQDWWWISSSFFLYILRPGPLIK